MSKTTFNKPVTAGYRGVEGYGSLHGVQTLYTGDKESRIMIIPVTAEGYTVSCKLEIPRESLPQFIESLNQLL